MRLSFARLGDRALRARVGSAESARAWAQALAQRPSVLEAWHTEGHVAVVLAPGGTLADLPAEAPALPAASERWHALPIVLDGPDHDEVARLSGLGARLDALLFEQTLTVSFLGFSPGFGYLRGLDPRLHLPRRDTPRPRVAARSLAIAGGFAGVYPSATSGGWHLLGHVQAEMISPDGARLAAGDRVRLVPATGPSTLVQAEHQAPRSGLLVLEARGLSFVEDGGRVGHLHEGVPPSGALLPGRLARANALLGNAAGAAGIERYGALRLGAAGATLELATDEGRTVRLRAGEHVDLDWHGGARAGYVAVRGGIDVPVVLGGRGTHVRAQLGGLSGRPLRKGDVLAVGTSTGTVEREPDVDPAAKIRVVPGPDLSAFADGTLARLTGTSWQLSHRSDRMGTLLSGTTLRHQPGWRSESAPLVMGAIEVPPDGVPIVLGPEHPTTGGYPVIAVVAHADLPAFFARPLGRTVQFRLAT